MNSNLVTFVLRGAEDRLILQLFFKWQETHQRTVKLRKNQHFSAKLCDGNTFHTVTHWNTPRPGLLLWSFRRSLPGDSGCYAHSVAPRWSYQGTSHWGLKDEHEHGPYNYLHICKAQRVVFPTVPFRFHPLAQQGGLNVELN